MSRRKPSASVLDIDIPRTLLLGQDADQDPSYQFPEAGEQQGEADTVETRQEELPVPPPTPGNLHQQQLAHRKKKGLACAGKSLVYCYSISNPLLH